ncbi:hypothetical protein ACHAWF_010544 [Thalassiosira exigua]
MNINAYPDPDFTRLYGYEDSLDPVCVHSSTDFSSPLQIAPSCGVVSCKQRDNKLYVK